jgi:uncharacterized protein
MSLETSNQQVVANFLQAFSSGDVPRTMGMMAESATWWVAGTMPISGTYDKAAFTALLNGVVDALEGPIQITPKAYTVQGERVAVEAESLAHTRSGRTYNNHYHFLITVNDGLISSVKEYLDTMHTNAVLCTP